MTSPRSDRESGSKGPTKQDMVQIRRRQFLGWIGGAAAGLGMGAKSALGRSFLGTDPGPEVEIAALLCTRSTYTTTITTTITTPSASFSTTLTDGGLPTFTTTVELYSTVSASGTATWTATNGTRTETITGTTSYTNTAIFTATITVGTGGQTQVGTRPSGTASATVTQSWTAWKTCRPGPTTPGGGFVIEPNEEGVIARNPAQLRTLDVKAGVTSIPEASREFNMGV